MLIKPSSLGDVIHALPVLHALRVRYPQAHIAWLVNCAFAPLVQHHPDLSETILFDRKRFGKLGRSPSASTGFGQFLQSLRRRKFDLVIDLQGLFRSGFLTRATGAPVRIGFRDGREASWLFYTHRLPKSPTDTHAVDRNCEALDLLGLADAPRVFDLAVTDTERRKAATLLADVGMDAAEPFVAVLPGARWETKQWPADRFATAVAQLTKRTRIRCVLVGGPNEQPLCNQIAECSGIAPPNLAGCTGLRDLIALIERSAAVLCHDSGPMHIAAALARPMVSIVGPTNPLRTGPYGHLESVLRLDLPCSPCYLRRLRQCGHEHRCMRELPAETVVERMVALLTPTAREIQG